MTLPGFENIDGMTKRAVAAIPQFLITLQFYKKSNPILSKRLEIENDLTGPEVRAIVSYLRVNGYPIASDSKGYYYAATPSELETTINHINGRAKRLLKVKQGLIEAQTGLQRPQRGLF